MTEQETIQILIEQFSGNLWERGAHRRIYFNDVTIATRGGLDWGSYKTGNISSATLNGEKISNSECRRILHALHTLNFKLWYNINDGIFYSQGTLKNANALAMKNQFVAAAATAIGVSVL